MPIDKARKRAIDERDSQAQNPLSLFSHRTGAGI